MAKGKSFIAGAIKHPGALRAKAHREHMSPIQFAEKERNAPGKTGQQARFALELRSFHKKGK
jgi:hypothetical protein